MADDDASGFGEMLRYGKVKSVDLAAGVCVVETGDVETAPIRWAETRLGDMKIWCPPSVGEQILLFCPEGDIEGAVILGAIPSDANPPAGDSRAVRIVMSDGTEIAYDPEAHALEAIVAGGGTARIEAADITLVGDVRIEGKLHLTGDMTADGKITADGEIQSGAIKLTAHKHIGVTAGGAQSGVPVA